MAQSRTKEMGIRKVLGVSVVQMVRLLVWQTSKPILWSLVITIPLSYFASKVYLDFFPDSFDCLIGIVMLSFVPLVLMAWIVVAYQARKVSVAKPIDSLRCE